MYIIEGLRKKYDILCDLVRPHITLVFPFDSALSKADMEAAITDTLADFSPFSMELSGLAWSDRWMFVPVTDGSDMIVKMHEVLYDKHFSQFKSSWLKAYTPHLTVGQFRSEEEAQRVYGIEKHLTESFVCKVKKISVEIIGDNDESILEMEYGLRGADTCIKKGDLV